MKKQILSIVLGISMLVSASVSHAAETSYNKAVTPQEKVIKDFTAKFLLAPTVSFENNRFTASLTVEGRQVSSFYNKKGNLDYTIVRYPASSLDKDVIDVVKNSYYSYYIPAMEKIQKPGYDDVYIVHLENKNSIKTVRVINGDTQLLESFKKN